MKKKIPPFCGSAAALVTPFTCSGKVDFDALGRMIEFQISSGTDALVFLGTTGESPSVTESERSEIIAFAVNRVKKRVPVIVGTGTNVTETTQKNCREAAKLGADALLAVTPYYSKASAAGLTEHFMRAASSADVPLILYTVPSRTGVNIPMEVYEKLAEIDNITAVKEASGNIAAVSDLCRRFGDSLFVYSGNDELTLPVIAVGGLGVISAAANIAPRMMHDLCRHALDGEISKARKLQHRLDPLIAALFSEVNPIPVKCACDMMGLCGETMRLPLCPMGEEKRVLLENEMKKLGLFP